jgi:hypothetical protein
MATVILGRQPTPGQAGQAQAWDVPDDAVDAVAAALTGILGDPRTDYLIPSAAVGPIVRAADGVVAITREDPR